jgi:hypothetical protein
MFSFFMWFGSLPFLRGRFAQQIPKVRDALSDQLVLVLVVLVVIRLDRQHALIAALLQRADHARHVDQPGADGHGREEVPLLGTHVAAGVDVLGVRGHRVRSQPTGRGDGIFHHPERVAGVEVDLQPLRIHALQDLLDFGRRVIDVILDGQHDAAVGGDLDAFLQHPDDRSI